MEFSFFTVFFVCFLAFILYSTFTKRGKGRFFGGKIIDTIGDPIVRNYGIQRTKIHIHIIEKKNGEKCIGIEWLQIAILAFSMKALSLSKDELKQLLVTLNKALDEI